MAMALLSLSSLATAGRRPVLPLLPVIRSFSNKDTANDEICKIPVPRGDYPFVGHLPRLIQEGDNSVAWAQMHQEKGEIVRAKLLGGDSFVITNQPSHAKEVLLNQGKYSYRILIKSFVAIFDANGWPQGITTADGEDWKRRRKVMGETLLNSKNAKEFLAAVVPAANHFSDCLVGHINSEGRLVETTTIREITGMFSLEAVMKVVVGVDFPACEIPINPKAASFAKAIAIVLAQSSVCEFLPITISWNLPPYKNTKAAWEEMYAYSSEQLEPILKYYKEHGELPEATKGTVLPKLIAQHEAGELSLDEVVGIGVQAIAGAVDTTGQTMEFFLYNLARNQAVQERLASDISAAFGTTGPLEISSIADYDKQRYLFAALKESMRLTPTIGVHVRTLVKDAQLGDHKVSKGEKVMINYQEMTKNPDLFPEPDLFLPERFLKQNAGDDTATSEALAQTVDSTGGCPMTAKRRVEAIRQGKAVCNDPYAAIPFGHGGRKCPGKGFAEMDVHLATIALLRKFKVHYDGPDLEVVERSILRSKHPIDRYFRFEARN
jgi:cytochrome P450